MGITNFKCPVLTYFIVQNPENQLVKSIGKFETYVILLLYG